MLPMQPLGLDAPALRSVAIVASRIDQECIAMPLRALSRAVTSIYDEALRVVRITIGQLDILAVLAKSGPMSLNVLAGILQMEKSTLSRSLARMRMQGWVSAARRTETRVMDIALTERGAQLLADGLEAWQSAQEQVRARISPQTEEAVRTAAQRLRTQRK